MSTIGIGIPAFNDYYLTKNLLDSIFFFTDRKDIDKIIVLDDGSESGYRNELKKICDDRKVHLIYNEQNLGVPRSWNRLVRKLGTDIVVLLNNDIVVWHGWLKNLIYFLENNPVVGTVSLPTVTINRADIHKVIEDNKNREEKRKNIRSVEILKPWDRTVRSYTYNLDETRDPIRAVAPMGCSFAFTRKVFDEVLGFNENYLYYFEEVDFGISLYVKNFWSYILPCPHVYHVIGGTFAENAGKINFLRVMEESKQKFINKYGCDQLELYRRLKEQEKVDFINKVKYIDWKGNEKEAEIDHTWSPFQNNCIEW